MSKEEAHPYKKINKDDDQEENYYSQSTIEKSGNSDIDIYITIDLDVKPVAFAMLYSLLASKQLSTEQFEDAMKRLHEL
ncbi:hypothetical protein ACNRWW_15960 [Metabacillus sp. HB246100]